MPPTNRGRRRTREEYAQGLPDYHDPTGGFGGAAPTYSALTLRIVLAAVGLLLAAGAAVVFAIMGEVWPAVVFGVIALAAAIDLGWVIHRKRRGEPG